MWSCVFCYFAGIYLLGTRFGLFKLLSRYGLSEIFDEIPKSFPEMKWLYIGLALYTLLFIVVVVIIYKVSKRQVEEQEQLQQEAATVVDYAQALARLIAGYDRIADKSDSLCNTTRQKLQTLQRQVTALPPAVARDKAKQAEIADIIKRLHNTFEELRADATPDRATNFLNAIQIAADDLADIRQRSVIIK